MKKVNKLKIILETQSICDPWKAQMFKEAMAKVTPNMCPKCLPDCSTTTYTTSVSALPFRRCDSKNLGLSKLCRSDFNYYKGTTLVQGLSKILSKNLLKNPTPSMVSSIDSTIPD